jgi:putative transcriptional regulator
MVRVRLSLLMGERKLKISDVARATKIDRGTITRLYHETSVRIDLATIDELCRYFSVSVCELLEYVELDSLDEN